MAKGQKKSNKEIRKPKAEKPKKNASSPSTRRGWSRTPAAERSGRGPGAGAPHPGRRRRLPGQGRDLPVAWRHEVPVAVVSNSRLRVPEHPLIERVMVSDGFDAADDWIAEAADARAVVVTADILLADRCLKAGAAVIGPNGKPFTASSIGARDRDPRDHGRPARRRGGRCDRRPAAVRQGRPLALPARRSTRRWCG